MRQVGFGHPSNTAASFADRLPGDLSATSKPSREWTATKELVADIHAVHALDVALRCAHHRIRGMEALIHLGNNILGDTQ